MNKMTLFFQSGGKVLGVLCVLLLAGCSQLYSYKSPTPIQLGQGALDVDQASRQATRSSLSQIRGIFRRKQPPPRPQDVVTPQVIAQSQFPILLMENLDNEGWALFLPLTENGDVLTWRNDLGQSLSFDEEGLMQASRGFGRDLMSADTAQMHRIAERRLSSAAGLVRVHDYLDGEDAVLRPAYVCNVKDAGIGPRKLLHKTVFMQEVQEECHGTDGHVFTNRYWRDLKTGLFAASEQWVSPEYGAVKLQLLTP